MKVGDLIKHKRLGGLALVVDIKEVLHGGVAPRKQIYQYPVFIWLDTNEIDSCADTFLEVFSESR